MIISGKQLIGYAQSGDGSGALPEALQNANPLSILRRVNEKLAADAII